MAELTDSELDDLIYLDYDAEQRDAAMQLVRKVTDSVEEIVKEHRIAGNRILQRFLVEILSEAEMQIDVWDLADGSPTITLSIPRVDWSKRFDLEDALDREHKNDPDLYVNLRAFLRHKDEKRIAK